MLRFAVLIVVVIVYGSLFPFDFRAAGGLFDAVGHLLHAWPDRTSFPDLIANVLLYMPLGFSVACAARPRIGWPAAFVIATMLGASLSICVELIQHFLPSRTTDLSDVLWNTVGVILGATGGTFAAHSVRGHGARVLRVADPIALLLAGAWIADRLWPFAPVLDVSHVKNALKPLLLHPQLVPADVLRHGTCWLAFAALLQAALPGPWSRMFAVGAMIGGPFVALIIVGRTITASSVVGAALAIAAWYLLSRRSPTATARAISVLLVATILCVGLAPYTLMDTPRPFDWIPFRAFVDGSILAASAAFLTKAFLYGTAVWAMARAGLGLAVSGGSLAALLVAIGWAQTYLPGRSAGITDGAIAVCMTLAIYFVRMPEPFVPEGTRLLARHARGAVAAPERTTARS
jgi:VanZ family protein